MITLQKAAWQTQDRVSEFHGLSTDAKPIDKVENGSVFYEIDTAHIYLFDKENLSWIKQ